jgi:hypothetical protein
MTFLIVMLYFKEDLDELSRNFIAVFGGVGLVMASYDIVQIIKIKKEFMKRHA